MAKMAKAKKEKSNNVPTKGKAKAVKKKTVANGLPPPLQALAEFLREPNYVDRLDLYNHMKLFDICESHTCDDQPFVTLERVVKLYFAQRGVNYENLFNSPQEGLEIKIAMRYNRDARNLPAIPTLPKSTRLCLLFPRKFRIAGCSPAFTSKPSIAAQLKLLETAPSAHTRSKSTPRPPPTLPLPALQLKMEHIGSQIQYDSNGDFIEQLCKGTPEYLQQAVNTLEKLLKYHFPTYEMTLKPYGSVKSGLAFQNSKVNINVQLADPELADLKKRDLDPYLVGEDAPYCFSKVQKILEKDYSVSKCAFDKATGFASFELKGLSVLRIEYGFNRDIVTRSTDMISEYTKLDNRIGPFLSLLKLFCRNRNIIAPSNGYAMRFYGYVVMALSYLTSCDPPVLPNLQNINFKDMEDNCISAACSSKKKYWDTVIFDYQELGIAARFHDCVSFRPELSKTQLRVKKAENGQLYWNSENVATVKKLFIDFLYHYAYEFDFEHHAVSMKSFGGYARRRKEFSGHNMVVEDPFCPGINLANQVNLKKVKDIFRGAFNCLYADMSFESMCRQPQIDKVDESIVEKPEYEPYMRFDRAPNCRAILLTCLPDMPEEDSDEENQTSEAVIATQQDIDKYCSDLEQLLSEFGKVEMMTSYDRRTMRVILSANGANVKDIVIPISFTFRGEVIYAIDLYESARIE